MNPRLIRAVILGAALVGLVTPAGCSSHAPSGRSHSAPAAVLTTAELPGLWAAYDKDNNAAIAASVYPRMQTKPWTRVDAEVVLDFDVFSTRAARYVEASKRSVGEPFFHHGEVLYAGSPTAYPQMAMVGYVTSRSQRAFESALAKDERGVALLVKAGPDTPWRMAATPATTRQLLPAALSPGRDSDPTQADDVAAVKVTQAIDAYLAGGKPRGFTSRLASDARLRTWLAGNAAVRKDPRQGTFEVDVAPYGRSSYRTGADGNVRLVRARGGVLAISSFRVTTSLHALPDTIAYNDGPYGELTGQTSAKKQRYVSEQYSVATLAWLPDGALPQLLAADLTYALG